MLIEGDTGPLHHFFFLAAAAAAAVIVLFDQVLTDMTSMLLSPSVLTYFIQVK